MSVRAADLVSMEEMGGLVEELGRAIGVCEGQKAALEARYDIDKRQENVGAMIRQTETLVKELKQMKTELEQEKEKFGAARALAEKARAAEKERQKQKKTSGSGTTATTPGTKMGKFTAPDWLGGRTPALLEISKDGDVVSTLDLAKRDVFIFGKQKELCHVVLDHASISRQHLALVHGSYQEVGWYLIDLNSAHGTGVKGPSDANFRRCEAQKPVLLPFGSSFKVGKSSRLYALNPDTRRSKKRPLPDEPS